jgi:putative DNA primase/helicase
MSTATAIDTDAQAILREYATKVGERAPIEPLSPDRLWTDIGLAERVMLAHGPNLRLIKGTSPSRWLEWDGKRWVPTGRERILRLVGEQVGKCYNELATLDPEPRARAARKVNEWERVGTQRQVAENLGAAADRHGRVVALGDLDRLPNRIATPDGVVDLATMTRRQARPDEYVTRLTAVSPRFETGDWARFVARAVPDPEVRAYLQKACGASILGRHREDKFWTIWGPEGTGKTTFSQAVKRALGDYATTARWPSLAPSKYESGAAHRADLFRIVGARIVTVEELPEDAVLDGALIKALSGGSPVPVRAPYSTESVMLGDCENFWVATNFKPRLDGSDGALFRRVVLLAFTNRFANSAEDRDLRERVWSDKTLPEVLGWLLIGAQNYLADPVLLEPEEVLARVEAYRRELDPLRSWAQERLERVRGAQCRLDELVADAEAWSLANDVFTDDQAVRKHLRREGIHSKRTTDPTSGKKYYAVRGCRLKDDGEEGPVVAPPPSGHAGQPRQRFSETSPARGGNRDFMESAVSCVQAVPRISEASGECVECGTLTRIVAGDRFVCLAHGGGSS